MHCTQFIDLAALMARQFLRLNQLGVAPKYEDIQAYWLASRYRQDHWNNSLHQHKSALAAASKTVVQSRAQQWHKITPILQEILVCEPLVRIIAYGARWLSESPNCVDFELLTTSVLRSHGESRNRVLHSIVFGHGMPVELAAKLNRLRRAMEGFNDHLLGLMPSTSNLDSFCFDSIEVAESQKQIRNEHDRPQILELHLPAVTLSVKHRLANTIDPRSTNRRLNRRLAEIVTAFWGNDSFDSLGKPKLEESIWVEQPSRECDPSHPKHPDCWLQPFYQLLKPSEQKVRESQVQNLRWQ